MKFIKLFILSALLTVSCSKGDEPKPQEHIQIHVRETWLLTVSEKGIVTIGSMIDSLPLSSVRTGERAVSYEEFKKAILETPYAPPSNEKNRTESVWALMPGNPDKKPISEALLLSLLSKSSRKWEFPGMSERLVDLLKRKPILLDLELQNKALHLADKATIPEKSKH